MALRALIALLLACAAALVHAAEQRVALVIGNSAYRDAPLPNPARDARLVGAALEAAGFRVTRLENAGFETMLKAITDFGDLLEQGGVGAFYYAGHGVQVRGENYLIPVDAVIRREEEIRTRAVNAYELIDRMASAGNRLNLVFFDACRNDPFPRRTRSAAQGLARMDAALGTLISFATAPGAVADDGGGQHSPYARHLAEAIRVPGLRVEDVLKRVRSAVRQDTGGRQVTWDNSSIEGDFYFIPPAVREAAPAPAAAEAEIAFWRSVESSGDPQEYALYLQRYPAGQFAELARRRMASAPAAAEAAKAPPAPAPVAALRDAPRAPAGPRPQAGDRWTYRMRSLWPNEPELTLEHAVLESGPSGVRESLSVAGTTTEQLFRSGMKVTERRAGSRALKELNPYLLGFGKLEPGMVWRGIDVPQDDPFNGEWYAVARAVALEKVKAPAGEFDALRMEVEMNRSLRVSPSLVPDTPARVRHVLWYAPAVRRVVRHERTVFSGNSRQLDRHTVELVSYSLN